MIAPRGADWTRCLDTGADDYIAAPYKTPVLLARFRALVRRCQPSAFGIQLSALPPVAESPSAKQRGETSPLRGGQPSTLPPRADPPVADNSQLRVGSLSLDLATGIARRGGKVIELTPLPARLLEYLMRHADKPCSRKDIIAEVWGYDFKPRSIAFLEVSISRLRAEIDFGFATRMIVTVRGVGYSLKADG